MSFIQDDFNWDYDVAGDWLENSLDTICEEFGQSAEVISESDELWKIYVNTLDRGVVYVGDLIPDDYATPMDILIAALTKIKEGVW